MPSFKEQLSELVASSGIQDDNWLNEVFELYMQSKSQKPRGIKKYIKDVQQFEEITTQINDLFKSHLKGVLREEEKLYHTLDSLQNDLDEANKKCVIAEQKYEALAQKYDLLKTDNAKQQETIELLNKTIKDNDQHIAQDRKTIAALEKVINAFDISDQRGPSTGKRENTTPKEDSKPKTDGRGKGKKNKDSAADLPPQLENQFETRPVSDETKRLQSEVVVQEADERKNYGPTISKENFKIETSTSERPPDTPHKE